MSPASRRVILANLLVPIVAWIAWDQYETRALRQEIAALAARGEPTSAAAVPAGGETRERYHAARVYAAAAEHVSAMAPDLTFRLQRIDVDSLTVTPNFDQLERTYRHDAPAIQLLEQAAPLDFNGFGDLADDVDRPALLTLGYLGLVHADLLSVRGQADAAATAFAACARLARTLEPFARTQFSTRMLGSLRILLRHGSPSGRALTALHQSFISLPDRDDLVADVRVRRARFLDDIAAPRRTVPEIIVRRAMRPWIARSNRRQLRTFDEVQTLAAGPWPEKLVIASQMMDRTRYGEGFRTPREGLVARQTLPPGVAYAGFGVRAAGSELAARRVMMTTVAVERYRADHGGAPASLEALVPAYLAAVPIDPFSGGPVLYRRTPESYSVYSVDQDQQDGGGALYGHGSKAQRQPPQGQPRDLGIQVAVRR